VIVTTEGLRNLAGTVTMVDGGFDPLHAGHIEYFRAAAELGPPVLCNVSGDEWVARKHPVLLPQSERTEIVDAIRFIAYTHASSMPTVEVLRALRPRYFAKGTDWEGRLPEDEQAVCEELGIELRFLDTVRGSSTAIAERFRRGEEPG
jgi:cytidyltransferase-like protein